MPGLPFSPDIPPVIMPRESNSALDRAFLGVSITPGLGDVCIVEIEP
jgi:hypothetical protein